MVLINELKVLPTEIQDIIYNYYHQININSINYEIKKISYRCYSCKKKFISFKKKKCKNILCINSFCKKCTENIINYQYRINIINNVKIVNRDKFKNNTIDKFKCYICFK